MSIPLAEAERRVTEARRVRAGYRGVGQIVGILPGSVQINGVPALQVDKCVVDHQRGTVTMGTWEDALRARAREKRAP